MKQKCSNSNSSTSHGGIAGSNAVWLAEGVTLSRATSGEGASERLERCGALSFCREFYDTRSCSSRVKGQGLNDNSNAIWVCFIPVRRYGRWSTKVPVRLSVCRVQSCRSTPVSRAQAITPPRFLLLLLFAHSSSSSSSNPGCLRRTPQADHPTRSNKSLVVDQVVPGTVFEFFGHFSPPSTATNPIHT